MICKIDGVRVAIAYVHTSALLRRKRGGTPSIGLATLPALEVLRKPTLTLFVKKPFLFWRKKIFLVSLISMSLINPE